MVYGSTIKEQHWVFLSNSIDTTNLKTFIVSNASKTFIISNASSHSIQLYMNQNEKVRTRKVEICLSWFRFFWLFLISLGEKSGPKTKNVTADSRSFLIKYIFLLFWKHRFLLNKTEHKCLHFGLYYDSFF